MDMEKAYDASKFEDDIYRRWEASGFFNPDNLPGDRKETFTIMTPPPNRTGILHVGHAVGLAIQDLMIRFERMRGKKTLFLPGTDHAAIATQVKVEGLLREKGMKDPRRELGREKFLAEVVKFAEASGATILKQTRKMGASCDWDRLAYTFDEPRNRAVNEMFRMMHEDGLIERGFRVVNWDPQFQTTLSDDEVLTKETKAKFLTFTYDKDFPITISTTRPETKFGDTAVAVHPDDERYAKYVGQTFTPTFCGKQLTIKVIADAAVDKDFGTGALGVTPAHSMIDSDMAQRHGLPMVQVIGTDGRMNEAAGPVAGMTIKEARVKIEEMLAAAGILKGVEEIAQNLPVAERGGFPVEQLPMKQWFVRANKKFKVRQDTLGKWKKGDEATLKELMLEAVTSKQVTILPDQFTKVYFHWINNLRDWCISRQIWFGHQIPVWYKGDELKITDVSPGEGWERDPDTLDTWFSSGTWTFSTLGWPEKTGDLKAYHPTDVLETGRDIIFFWVARMILMSTYALGDVPFKTVYLHGLVRDEQGRKMSKSLGNIIDPLDVSAKYGTDAVRLSLVIGSAAGADTKLGEEKIAGYRNFTNKLWNISRFVLTGVADTKRVATQPEPKTDADTWLLKRLEVTKLFVTQKLEQFEFSAAGEELRDFTWSILADWYLETAKIQKQDAALAASTDAILLWSLENVLKLWHPYMPLVTEAIWSEWTGNTAGKEFLMIEAWPEAQTQLWTIDKNLRFEVVREIVSGIRNLRSEYKVEPAKKIDATIFASDKLGLIEENLSVVKALARLENVTLAASGDKPVDAASTIVSGIEIHLPMSGMVDPAKEKERLAKEQANLANYVAMMEAKLSNPGFTDKAPPAVIEKNRATLAEKKAELKKIEETLKGLG